MPVDNTKPPISRRPQRKITEEELKDIEIKRLRGELSCAECRRLKLRCDKKVPCGSCVRRGCESICPCGILSAGQGTRFILADTEQLHHKIAEMSHRIRQLEDGLAILQATVSSERHPLLSDELIKIKFGAETLTKAEMKAEMKTEETEKQSIDALGTLTLDDTGETKYFGRSAGSETLLMAGEEWDTPSSEDDEDLQEPFPPELDRLANLFPFTTKQRTNTALLELLESHLPSYERAWTLGESYLAHGAYFFRPAKRDEVFEVLLPTVYNNANARQQRASAADSPGSNEDGQDASGEDVPMEPGAPHALAMLFMLFALGALLDLNNPPYNQEAERYYALGRGALSLRSVFDGPQVTTVQAVGLMATYHSLAGKKYSRDSAWGLMSLAAKLAQSVSSIFSIFMIHQGTNRMLLRGIIRPASDLSLDWFRS
ncbi:hypothetical protein HGRIS_005396 [Hohenbuehelia grisea]|uniref:Zn(2)-C6 fungal-type domain-containing protein n=1 Tax=Hohenbuehelia grisea TaxID=104357 RepID=A0ABR3JFT2_9AGAR